MGLKQIVTDKGSAFTFQIMTEIMKTPGIQIEHATIKHAQTIGLVEHTHEKLKQILKINVAADFPRWDKYVNIADMPHNTTYHRSLKCSLTEVFQGRVPHDALDLNFGNPLRTRNTSVELTKILDKVNENYKQT